MSLTFAASSSTNPKQWRYTWEAQSHTPTLRLLLFSPRVNPNSHCLNLQITLIPQQFHLLVTYYLSSQNDDHIALKVPIPRVLLDAESPFHFRATDDHIEVKLSLLLPVDHPIVSEFSGGDRENEPLLMDSDVQSLSAKGSGGGVHFYCRNCSVKLTRHPISNYVEMPSSEWQEAADNWFGGCCCSFGGISEKLVNRYANNYVCAKGTCLLNSTSVVLCKDDLVDCSFSNRGKSTLLEFKTACVGCNAVSTTSGSECNHETSVCCENKDGTEYDIDQKLSLLRVNSENSAANRYLQISQRESRVETASFKSPVLSGFKNMESKFGSCPDTKNFAQDKDNGSTDCFCNISETFLKDQVIVDLRHKKSFLNGYLENIFMARSSHLSQDVDWIELMCPQCSSLLGAYPSCKGYGPLDDGVRLLKCYISTCLPIGGSDDIFRKYTLESMVANQLQESAKDELSFRTLVRDLRSRSPALQLVLINPNSWCFSGYCLGTDTITEPTSQINLFPAMKVLFSAVGDDVESQKSVIEDWRTKKQADEVYMLTEHIKAMTESLESARDIFPPSYAYLQGLSLSHIRR